MKRLEACNNYIPSLQLDQSYSITIAHAQTELWESFEGENFCELVENGIFKQSQRKNNALIGSEIRKSFLPESSRYIMVVKSVH